jgi:hypothetical protein
MPVPALLANPYVIAGLSSFLSGLGGALTGGDQPEATPMGSFEGSGATDPIYAHRELLASLRGGRNALEELLSSPISLPSAFAQQLPAFSGGGLPMPIGVTGVDPALRNPGMLTRKGINIDLDEGGEFGGSVVRRAQRRVPTADEMGAAGPVRKARPSQYREFREYDRDESGDLTDEEVQEAIDAAGLWKWIS